MLRSSSSAATGSFPRGAAAVASLAAALVLAAPARAETTAVTQTFTYTGAAQSWVVPSGVSSAVFTLAGAQGGDGAAPGSPTHSTGGKGATLLATLAVNPGDVFGVYVGGSGGGNGSTNGGWNGGGSGGEGSSRTIAGGGGGASDVRLDGGDLNDRILVAGGGGGGGGSRNVSDGIAAPGGDGGASSSGGTTAGNLGPAAGGGGGGGGTDTTGGAGGAGSSSGLAGEAGAGGGGATGSFVGSGGGGGGGFFGGGGGGAGSTAVDVGGSAGGGGGGGSSFSAPEATQVDLENDDNLGDGEISISYEVPVLPTVTIDSAPDAPLAGPATFAFSSAQSDSAFRCRIDGAAYSPCTSPATYAGLAVGSHTFDVIADSPEGLSSAPASRSFTVAAPPEPPTPDSLGTVGAKAKQKVRRGKVKVAVRLAAAADIRAVVTGRCEPEGSRKSLALKRQVAELKAGQQLVLNLVPKKDPGLIRRAIERGRTVVVQVKVRLIATDGTTELRRLRIRLT